MLQFISNRFPVEKLNFNWLLKEKSVPIHKMTWGYYTGGLVLFFLIIQVITGLLLLLTYQSTVTDAYVSVKQIMDNVAGGALIRNMHTWSSSLMIFFSIVHLLTTFSMKAFERPREITWIAGVFLLFITFAFGFTGYLLPWNQLSVNATKVLLQSLDQASALMPGLLSEIPNLAKHFLQGGETIGQATLSRFFALHVVILPAVTLVVLGIHLLSIQIHGMSQGVDNPSPRSEKFFPCFLSRDLSVWSVAFLILYTIALCLPFDSFISFPLLEPYDPFGATPVGIKPEWYFYFIYYPLELLPFWLVMLILSLVCLVLLLTPWIFARVSRKVLSAVAFLSAIYLFVISVFGQNIYNYFRGGLIVLLIASYAAAPAFAYPAFQRFSEKHSGRTVNCAMCHVNPQGPSGKGYGQLLSLTAAELEKVDAARNSSQPGLKVDSPIMNKFGNHIIRTLGMDKVNAAIAEPELLAKDLGDKSDLDGDGISDAREFLDGTDPLNKFNGEPKLLLGINLSRYKMEIFFVAVAIGFIIFGLSGFVRSRETK